jgi:uncharacterized membrane protein
MNKGRLEAFSDGVFAIIITIMVLELKAPHGDSLASLRPLLPIFFSYVISFIYVAIYWNNHHHLFQLVKHVDGRTLLANVHLLFWLSLVPFVTAWSGENHFAPVPVALYGVCLLMAAIAYFILTRVLLANHGRDSDLARALGSDFKGKVSAVIYAVAIPLACYRTGISLLLYVLVAAIWIIPDRRVERVLKR